MLLRRHFLATAAAATVAAPSIVRAQAWPSRPITLVVPFPAGGGTDAFARPLATQLSAQLGQQVVIDNRGGAGGTLGAGIAARATPDGYTYLVGAAHHAIAPAIYPKLEYDIEQDFVPVTMISSPPQVIVAHPGRVPETTLSALIERLRREPGKLNYGSAGNGTSHHLAGEMFKILTKTDVQHIPFSGAGPALRDLVGGQIDLMFDGLGSSAGHIRGGRIKALAVAAATRSPAFPDVPTAAEAGLPGYEVATWYAIWAPRRTPAEVVTRMYDEVRKAIATPTLTEIWLQNGSTVPDMTPDAFGAFVKRDIARWAAVVKEAGVKLE
jgi:tripartite-type tricarboxylate transporter receptor subunit TctC